MREYKNPPQILLTGQVIVYSANKGYPWVLMDTVAIEKVKFPRRLQEVWGCYRLHARHRMLQWGRVRSCGRV